MADGDISSADEAASLAGIAATDTQVSKHSELKADVTQAEFARSFLPLETWDKRDDAVLLLVDYSDGDHPLEDDTIAVTIGHNNDHNVGDDEGQGWQFAGWCWCHDHYVQGKGKVVGWLPLGVEKTVGIAHARPDSSDDWCDWAADNWREQGYKTAAEEVQDMAAVGRSMMERYAGIVSEGGEMAGWTPMDDPAEIVTAMADEISELRNARPADDVVEACIAEMADCIDRADAIISLNCGLDTPKEWDAAIKRVSRSRAALAKAGAQ